MSREDMITANLHDFARGVIGSGSALLAALTTTQEQLEFWLRVASLLVGIGVGIISGWSILRRMRRQ